MTHNRVLKKQNVECSTICIEIHCCNLWNVLRCLVLNISPTENIGSFTNDKPFTWIYMNVKALCVLLQTVYLLRDCFVIASFCFILFCEISESGMEKA